MRQRRARGSDANQGQIALTLIVDPSRVRQAFTDAGLERKAAQGEITQIVREVKTSRFARGDPRFGWSQEIVQWWNEGRLVAIVHQWRDASGELAASGRPDPKWLCTSGIGGGRG
jgi:hypothetical protein